MPAGIKVQIASSPSSSNIHAITCKYDSRGGAEGGRERRGEKIISDEFSIGQNSSFEFL